MNRIDEKRESEIIRVVKRPSSYVTIDKTFLEDPNLSWKAKGLLAYMLSKPDNWRVIVADLIKQSRDGRDAVYAGLDELKKNGYYRKVFVRNELGKYEKSESVVHELPEAANPVFTDRKTTYASPAASAGSDASRVIEHNVRHSFDTIPKKPVVAPSYPHTAFPYTDKPETGLPYTEKPEDNKNYLTKYINNNNKSVMSVCPKTTDRTDKTDDAIEIYTERIKTNIDYDSIAASRPLDIRLVDEFIAVAVDAILTAGDTVTVGGESKPRALVTAVLLKLAYDSVLLAVDKYLGVSERIVKKRRYILTLLYNCVLEVDSHYANAVRAGPPIF